MSNTVKAALHKRKILIGPERIFDKILTADSKYNCVFIDEEEMKRQIALALIELFNTRFMTTGGKMSKSNGKKKTLVTTTNTNTNKKDTKPTTTMTTEIGRDEIAMRAYSIFLSGKGGSELDHWLQAERELTSTHSRMHT